MNILDTTKSELYHAILCEAKKYCNDFELLNDCMGSLDIDRLVTEKDELKLRTTYRCHAKMMAYNASMYEPDEDCFDDETISYSKAIACYSIVYGLFRLLYNHFKDQEGIKELANSIFDIGVPQENSGQYLKALATYHDAKSLIVNRIKEIYESIDKDITLIIHQSSELLFLYDVIERRIGMINRLIGSWE